MLTFHPEVSARAAVFGAFADTIRRLHADPRIVFVRCPDVVEALSAGVSPATRS